MESKYFQIERSRIEYHRSHEANNIVVCFQIKKERNSIYLSTLIPYSSILPCTRFNFTSKEITEERGRQRNQCTPSITFIPSIKLWPTRHELCQLGQSELRDLVKMLMACSVVLVAMDGENIGRLRIRISGCNEESSALFIITRPLETINS